ncbi:MAG TPA: hypothetical protein VFO88_00935 [Gaiellaceae bacterium]|nr:hypothetical protein [Gaiellaceae bacterium]
MQGQKRWRIIALLATGIAIGVVMAATPATGHISGWAHNWTQHIKPKTDARYYTKQQSNDRFRNHIPGGPLAGASVGADGTLIKWFNRRGGAPTIEKLGTGAYRLTFPGLEGQAAVNNSVALVSLLDSGQIYRTSSSGNPYIFTSDSAGAAADRSFDLVIFRPGALLRPAVARGGPGGTDG